MCAVMLHNSKARFEYILAPSIIQVSDSKVREHAVCNNLLPWCCAPQHVVLCCASLCRPASWHSVATNTFPQGSRGTTPALTTGCDCFLPLCRYYGLVGLATLKALQAGGAPPTALIGKQMQFDGMATSFVADQQGGGAVMHVPLLKRFISNVNHLSVYGSLSSKVASQLYSA